MPELDKFIKTINTHKKLRLNVDLVKISKAFMGEDFKGTSDYSKKNEKNIGSRNTSKSSIQGPPPGGEGEGGGEPGGGQ